jgi:hypothetical protein
MIVLAAIWHAITTLGCSIASAADAAVKYVPYVTAIALVFAVYQYVQITRRNRIAAVNALFETMKHNLNIRKGLFFQESPETNRTLARILKSIDERGFYPNPTDSTDTQRQLYDAASYVDDDKLPYATEYMPLLHGSIKTAFETGYYHRLLKRRIVLNLGHLNFGLERNNIRLKNFNTLLSNLVPAETVVTNGFKDDYMKWVHFRQLFLLLDLVYSYRKAYFSDEKEYERLKSAFIQ